MPDQHDHHVKLVYFPVRGRGELLRLLLHAAGVDYEEEAVTFEEWPARKPCARSDSSAPEESPTRLLSINKIQLLKHVH